MWEQKTDDGGSGDKDNTYTWKDALAYCENLILGDHSDWRMPTPKEFERLVDLSKSGSPKIDTLISPIPATDYTGQGTTCSGCHRRKAFAEDFIMAIYIMETSIMKGYIMKIMYVLVLQLQNQR